MTISISSWGSFIAHIPGLFGFTPEDSVILGAIDEAQHLGPIVRVDLPTLQQLPIFETTVLRAMAHMYDAGAMEVGCVIISTAAFESRHPSTVTGSQNLDNAAVLGGIECAVQEAVLLAGLDLNDIVVTPLCLQGQQWYSLLDESSGVVGDPRETVAALERSISGTNISALRRDIERDIDQRCANFHERHNWVSVDRTSPPVDAPTQQQLSHSPQRKPDNLSARTIYRFTCACVSHYGNADGLVALLAENQASEWVAWWEVLIPAFPVEVRQHIILAVSLFHYANGDGFRTQQYLRCALQLDPQYNSAAHVLELVDMQMHPAKIRDMISELAAEITPYSSDDSLEDDESPQAS